MKKRGKKLAMLLASLMLVSLVGCGSSGKKEVAEELETASSEPPVPIEEFDKVLEDPSAYKGRQVEFYGKVFVDPKKDGDTTQLQVYAGKKGTDNNVLVYLKSSDFEAKQNDIVRVRGVVGKVKEGKNAFGADLNLPSVDATSVDKSTYAEAFMPAIKTVDVNKDVEQHGYAMTVKKVEFAKEETRVYVKVKNNSQNKITFYDFNCKLTQGSNQMKQKDNYDAKYPEIESEILPGIEQEGIVVFGPADTSGETVKFISEGRSDNYKDKFELFTFDIAL